MPTIGGTGTRRHERQNPGGALIKAASSRLVHTPCGKGGSEPASQPPTAATHPRRLHGSFLLPPPAPPPASPPNPRRRLRLPLRPPRLGPNVGRRWVPAPSRQPVHHALSVLSSRDFSGPFLTPCLYWELIRWPAGAGRRRPARGDSQGRGRAEDQGAGQGQADSISPGPRNIQFAIRFSSSRCGGSR